VGPLATPRAVHTGRDSFSITGIAYALGLPLALGTVLGLTLGGGAVLLSFSEGHRGRRDAAFTYGLLAALLLSPIVWMHYLALLPVAIAARHPRFGIAWLLPLALWPTSSRQPPATSSHSPSSGAASSRP
jgi:hypothetical protein